jgi:hypothetical protein
MFLNCHLTHGEQAVMQRFEELQFCFSESNAHFMSNTNE